MRLVEPSISFSSLWSPALIHYTKYTAEELGAVIKPLAEVLFLAPSAKLGTVYTKFCNKKFMKISRIPLLDDPILRKIAKGEVGDQSTLKKSLSDQTFHTHSFITGCEGRAALSAPRCQEPKCSNLNLIHFNITFIGQMCKLLTQKFNCH